ncbi:MAG: HD domain-containing protein [Proteobacteria bacterium]|nr:HD domain-containing protein [Pseudomonadota bacterium]
MEEGDAPAHHPEGGGLIHTLMMIAEASKISTERGLAIQDRKLVMLSALVHDLGKGSLGATPGLPGDQRKRYMIDHYHGGAGERAAGEILSALELSDCQQTVFTVVNHHMEITHRCCQVIRGEMPRYRCIDRTRAFLESIRRRADTFNPEVLEICVVADWCGRGTKLRPVKREPFVSEFRSIWNEARQKLRGAS